MAAALVRLAILDTYGVRWSREVFARDVLQNFFDAAPDYATVSIAADRRARTLEVRGPAAFDLDLLAYVGATTKNDGTTAGGFGEGFKICALVATRDLGLRLRVGCGSTELEAVLVRAKLGRELCYRRRPIAPVRGSYVRLERCDDETFAAFDEARHLFRHPNNPKIGEAVAATEDRRTVVARSRIGEGEIYYRRQQRGSIRWWGGGVPLTLLHDTQVDALEGDRDRRDLSPYDVAFAIGGALPAKELHRVFLVLEPYWRYGHDVLRGLLDASIARKLRWSWPTHWLARATGEGRFDAFAERQGFKLALGAFAEVGMPTADERYRDDLETFPPAPIERARYRVVRALYSDLVGPPSKERPVEVFAREGAAVAGQHLPDKVIVARELFHEGFDAVAGTILHELAHEAGDEESSGFHRKLVRLLAGVIARPERVREAREAFERVTEEDGHEIPPPETSEGTPDPLYDFRDDDGENGVRCVLMVPSGFPPSREIWRAVDDAAARAGVRLDHHVDTIDEAEDAEAAGARGVPSIWLGDRDLDEASAGAIGLYLRLYDGAIVPPDALLDAAFARVSALSAEERTAAWQARRVRLKEVRETCAIASGRRRDQQLRLRAHEFAGSDRDALADAWCRGIRAAASSLIARRRRVRGNEEGRDVEEIWKEIEARVSEAIVFSRTLRTADVDFDDADAFEAAAMAAAQGAAVIGHVQADGEEGMARAKRDFGAVRSLTERTLAVPISAFLKVDLLTLVLEAGGMASHYREADPNGFDPERAEQAFAVLVPVAVELQRETDAQGRRWIRPGGLVHHAEARSILACAVTRTPSVDEIVRRAYDAAWAESADAVAAARRAIEACAAHRSEAS